MWIEIPKMCEAKDCKEKATHFYTRKTLIGSHWGFFCKYHAKIAEAGHFMRMPSYESMMGS